MPVMARALRRRVRGEMMKPRWGAGGMGTLYFNDQSAITNQQINTNIRVEGVGENI